MMNRIGLSTDRYISYQLETKQKVEISSKDKQIHFSLQNPDTVDWQESLDTSVRK